MEPATCQSSFTYLLWLDPSVKVAERLQILLVPTQSEQPVDPLCRQVLQQPMTDVRGQQTPLLSASSLGIPAQVDGSQQKENARESPGVSEISFRYRKGSASVGGYIEHPSR